MSSEVSMAVKNWTVGMWVMMLGICSRNGKSKKEKPCPVLIAVGSKNLHMDQGTY
jgi:hypothetical protein